MVMKEYSELSMFKVLGLATIDCLEVSCNTDETLYDTPKEQLDGNIWIWEQVTKSS